MRTRKVEFWSSVTLTGNQTYDVLHAITPPFWSSVTLTGNQTSPQLRKCGNWFWSSVTLTGNQTVRAFRLAWPKFWSSVTLTGNQTFGWWSNANRLGVVNHEMGHYAHNVTDSANGQSVCDHYLELLLRRFRDEAADGAAVDWSRWGKQGHTPPDVVKRARENGLSGYALTNTHEMVAESFAELYDGGVSDQAREVLKTLLTHSDKINAPENALLKRRLEQL